MYSFCIDFNQPLENRLERVGELSDTEKEALLEHICSAYLIHSLFIYEQYLEYLILRSDFPLFRRIRIAELCDLGLILLYLLTRIPTEHERIRCIEWFSNPYLKIHAYHVMFPKASLETQIQIFKNMCSLPRVDKKTILEWFMDRMTDDTLAYPLRSNCADAILNFSENSDQIQSAKTFLGITDFSKSVWSHRENVHLFLPNMKTLETILENAEITPLEEIVKFIETQNLPVDLFWKRIVNDKTRFGKAITLEILITKVWSQLTPDLRKVLIEDLYSSEMEQVENQWMCTTGYYNRIINIYQTMITDQTLFDSQQEFNSIFNQRINHYLFQSDEKDDILLEMPEKGEERRIRYLTFKIHALPLLIDELRKVFPSFSEDEFDQCFSVALRQYENTLD